MGLLRLGIAEDMRMARLSHCRCRADTHRLEPKARPELTNGRYEWWMLVSSYSVWSIHVTYEEMTKLYDRDYQKIIMKNVTFFVLEKLIYRKISLRNLQRK